jgi:virginiamycin B lyase
VRIRRFLLVVIVLASGAGIAFQRGHAAAEASIALSGQVTSAEEGPMEGVLVSAKKAGSTITTTVVTDEKGHYSFPGSRLEPGHYALRVRAAGYDLEGPNAIDIGASDPVAANLKLRKTADLAAQLSNAEWLVSFPGTAEQKASVQGCTHCHTLEPVVRSRHDADEFMQVLDRMSHYTPESFPLMIQPPTPGRMGGGELNTDQQSRVRETRRKQAEYLATLNLSSGSPWSYPLKPFARPKGRSTHMIMTEYDLPKRTRQPHDVVVDAEGMVWYAGFGEAVLGKLDPQTGKITEYPMPVLKPKTVIGNLDVEFDRDQNIWIAMTFQSAVAKFDRKTEKFQIFRLPPELDADYREITFVSPTHSDVDGKVWMTDAGTYTVFRLDIATGKFEVFEPFPKPRPNIYQIVSDEQNNAWFMALGAERVGRIDAKTGKISLWQTPTPRSAPRRGRLDAQGRLWFGENRGNKIGMFDTKTEKFQEWDISAPEYFPYDVVTDKNGEAWAATEFSDTVLRLDPNTGETVQYLLPRPTNMRRVFVDNATTPVTFWVGNTHAASVVRVEPLDNLLSSKR